MLETLIKQEKPRVAQHKKRHAQILLAIDENHSPLTHEQTAKALNVKPVTISRLRQRFCEEGLEIAVNSKHSRHGRKRKLDGEGQARLAAITCSPPPEGRGRWTLNLLRDKMVELEYYRRRNWYDMQVGNHCASPNLLSFSFDQGGEAVAGPSRKEQA